MKYHEEVILKYTYMYQKGEIDETIARFLDNVLIEIPELLKKFHKMLRLERCKGV